MTTTSVLPPSRRMDGGTHDPTRLEGRAMTTTSVLPVSYRVNGGPQRSRPLFEVAPWRVYAIRAVLQKGVKLVVTGGPGAENPADWVKVGCTRRGSSQAPWRGEPPCDEAAEPYHARVSFVPRPDGQGCDSTRSARPVSIAICDELTMGYWVGAGRAMRQRPS